MTITLSMESKEMESLYDYEFGTECVLIDPYNSDLNLIIDRECLLAYPMSGEGFSSMWAGCRANYGIDCGKVAFEVHLEDYCDNTSLPKDNPEQFCLRVGWSLFETSLLLGENSFSYAYCNNGKKSSDGVLEEYGESFEKGDSIASYIDFESDTDNIIISFSKNGTDMGTAFIISKLEFSKKYETEFSGLMEFKKSSIDSSKESVKKRGYLFFPHVLSKNIVFDMNFGQRVSLIGDEPFAPIKPDYLLIQKVSLEKRFYPDILHSYKKKREAIILVGLPGVGKTNWANDLKKKNPNKSYYLIGVSSILENMKTSGLKKRLINPTPIISNSSTDADKTSTNNNEEKNPDDTVKNTEETPNDSAGSTQPNIISQTQSKISPDMLDKLLKCLNTLIEIASQSNRNIILDQPNIYGSTRRRKLKMFENFERRAVVLLPSDDVYNQRLLSLSQRGKEVCVNLVNDMKANFSLPKASDQIDSIEYAELNEEEAIKLVQTYNKEGSLNRLNSIISKRMLKQQTGKQNVAKNMAINNQMNLSRPNIRMNNYQHTTMPYSPNDPSKQNRFNPNFQGPRRFSYFNPPNSFNPPPPHMMANQNPYMRPQMVVNNCLNIVQPIPIPSYNMGQPWPPVATTPIWNQHQIHTSNWAPVLPISNVNVSHPTHSQPIVLNSNNFNSQPQIPWTNLNQNNVFLTNNNNQPNNLNNLRDKTKEDKPE